MTAKQAAELTVDQLRIIESLLSKPKGSRQALVEYLATIGRTASLNAFESLTIGSLVQFMKSGNAPGRSGVGVVYNIYTLSGRRGVSIIQDSGFYDGWSLSDWLLFGGVNLGDYCLDYVFTDVGRLSNDFDGGVFEAALQYGSEIAVARQ